jgi:hypothetical protein
MMSQVLCTILYSDSPAFADLADEWALCLVLLLLIAVFVVSILYRMDR